MNTSTRQNQPTQVLAITSGKGGVGKTSIAINLALALADRQRKVTLFDADLTLANIDVLLDLKPLRNLSHVIEGDCTLNDIIIRGPGDINIIPAASGIKIMHQLTPAQHVGLVHVFDELSDKTDYLIVDTSAGISDSVVRFCSAAQEVLVVVCNDPASIADAYALIKTLHRDFRLTRFQIIINRVQTEAEGAALFEHLRKVTERYLDVVIALMGILPEDANILRAGRKRYPLFLGNAQSKSIKTFKKMAAYADSNRRTIKASGRLTFFAEQMMRIQNQQPTRAIQ